MKKDWVYKKLGEVANVIHGKNQKEVLSTNGKYPIYGSGGTIMGYATEYLCEAGTTILGRKGTINNPQFINHKFWNVDTAFGISARKDIDSKFLYFFIKKQDWSKMNTGTTLPSLTQAIVKNVIIPVPPLSEQKEIVEYLDSSFAKIDKLKENAAKNLEEAKALSQSALKNALEPKEGWEEKKMVEVCTIERGGSPRPIKKFLTKEENGLNWIKIGDTDPQGKYIYSTAEKIIPEGLKKSRWVDVDDFLLSNSMSFGRPYILKTNGCIHDGWLVLRNYQNFMNIDFFYYLLISPLVQRQFKIKAQGSTVSNLNTQRVADVAIYIPPLPEQQSIVSFLDSLNEKVNTLQQNYSRICDECDALKQAILRQVFE